MIVRMDIGVPPANGRKRLCGDSEFKGMFPMVIYKRREEIVSFIMT